MGGWASLGGWDRYDGRGGDGVCLSLSIHCGHCVAVLSHCQVQGQATGRCYSPDPKAVNLFCNAHGKDMRSVLINLYCCSINDLLDTIGNSTIVFKLVKINHLSSQYSFPVN